MKKKIFIAIIIIVLVVGSFVVLAIASRDTGIVNRDIKEWREALLSKKPFLTVLASSECPHCQEYLPVLKRLVRKYKFEAFFYELDQIEEIDKQTLLYTLPIPDYKDEIPFSYVIDEGEYKDFNLGYDTEEEIRGFLIRNGLINN